MPKIKIYTTPFCVYCKKAKEFFEGFGFKYEEIDASKDNLVVNEIIQKTGQMAVPVIEINNQVIVGFNESQIKKLLNLA